MSVKTPAYSFSLLILMLTQKKKQITLVALIGLFVATYSYAERERILSFQSDITVHKDASMSVTETITVQSAQEQIQHGIFRDFPTHYTGKWGTHYNIIFSINKITRDGKPEPYHLREHHNGVTIIIGDKDRFITPGVHTYTITYHTNRQLGFFDNYDELYWNVTGNGWQLPIEQATARITLPVQLAPDVVHVEAYTGPQGAKGTAYTAQVSPDGVAEFATTAPLGAREGLTIVVTWPKAIVTPPTALMNAWYFIQDNYQVLILLFLTILWLIIYCILLVKVRRTRDFGTIIPLFTPPTNMSAAEVYYLTRGPNLAKSAKLFGIAAVQAAVEGFLVITTKPQWFTKQYTLTSKKCSEKSSPTTAIVIELFASQQEVELLEKNRPLIVQALSRLMGYVSNMYQACFTSRHLTKAVGGLIVLAISSAVLLPWFLLVCLPLLALLYPLLRAYTPQGQKIMQEIEGFKLFLATTETERLKIIGTPPTRTPELYETYLPYAMALGVEKQWTKQFTPVFAKMEAEGHPYTPVWFVGAPISFETLPEFTSSLQSSLSSTISSSAQAPGSSSGSGGGGSSGGGGGGGGGGGW